MRDFTNERLTVVADGLMRLGTRQVVVALDGTDIQEDGAFAVALASQWNACREALAVLESGAACGLDARVKAIAILRPAVYGEG